MKLIITLVISSVGALLDGFGLAMFLPLLSLTEEGGDLNGEGLGKLKFLVDGLEKANIPLNLPNILLVICDKCEKTNVTTNQRINLMDIPFKI